MRASTSERDFFSLFGLPKGFALDEKALAERYRRLQQEAHPDRFAGASPQERRLAVQQAALINEAFQTLRDPVRRALYLLSLAGVEGGSAMDPAFLEEQMALREALAAIETPKALEGFLRDIDGRIAALIEILEGAFAKGALEEAAEKVKELQFLRRLREEALAKEDEWME